MIRHCPTLASGLALFGLINSGVAQRPLKMHQGPPPTEENTLPPIVKKALVASRKLSYIGTRVVEFRREGVPSKHEETITRQGSHVRIDFPDGGPQSGQVIVENSHERRHFFPDKNEIQILPPRREEALERLARQMGRGKRHFVLSMAPGQMIAGIRTEQVVVADEKGNVTQRLYIDSVSGLILKRQLFDQVGTAMGGFEFTRVDLSPHIEPSLFTISHKGALLVTPEELMRRAAKKSGFLPIALPSSSGFHLEGTMTRKIEGVDVLMETYGSKEGRRLTLFQLASSVSPFRLREFAKRQELEFVYWQGQGKSFVLMGGIDANSLLQIAGPISGGTAVVGR